MPTAERPSVIIFAARNTQFVGPLTVQAPGHLRPPAVSPHTVMPGLTVTTCTGKLLFVAHGVNFYHFCGMGSMAVAQLQGDLIFFPPSVLCA